MDIFVKLETVENESIYVKVNDISTFKANKNDESITFLSLINGDKLQIRHTIDEIKNMLEYVKRNLNNYNSPFIYICGGEIVA